jgi:prepilin-type N-terminal cleavage/methylation domain-containing protein
MRRAPGREAAWRHGEAGFALIELLVVMVIVGILAAFALPTFFNQKDKAGDARAKEYVHSAVVAMETYSTDNNGKYTGVEEGDLKGIEPTLDNASFLEVEGGKTTYRVDIEGGSAGQEFWVERDAKGELRFGCNQRDHGGCPSTGNWGE